MTRGWIKLHNGLLLIGLDEAHWDPNSGYFGSTPPGVVFNNAICIDVNGADGPNLVGQDVYAADFNPQGDFDTNLGVPTFQRKLGRAFLWGNDSQILYDNIGNPLPAPFDTPESRAGSLIAP